MKLTLGEVARRVGGVLHGAAAETEVAEFVLDSREPRSGGLFLAIKGARSDGHDFIDAALAGGCVAALAERPVAGPHIHVENLVNALAELGRSFRHEFQGPVIGITGSAGKTTTKEFLAAALAPLGTIAKTTGNRNTEYTAPLMWAEREGGEAAVVVEMSMRGFGQIDHLAKISLPTMGIITNIGHSHLELVGSRQGIAKAKSELFDNLPDEGLAIAWQGDPYLEFLRGHAHCETQTFGFTEEATLQITGYRPLNWSDSEITVRVDGQEASAHIPAVGRHLALNAGAALLAAVRCGVSLAQACEAIRHAEVPAMRMQPIPYGDALLIMDNYNASPNGFVAALETMGELPCKGKRIVIAGEMKELGDMTEDAHRMVGLAIARMKLDEALFLGDAMNYALDEVRRAGYDESRARRVAFIHEISERLASLEPGDVVLIKGSRAMELEKAVDLP